jgi:hypothetical protein
MKTGEKIVTTMTTLANAVELSASVIERIAGEEISNHLDGKPVRVSDLTDAVAAKLQASLSKRVSV